MIISSPILGFDRRRDVFTADTARALDFPALYRDVFAFNAEARDPQLLNRCLYSDYQTIIDFYLRRNDLIRSFGIEIRYPLFDHELVEYCARIPLSLKIRGWFDTKYIMRKAMEPVLPHEIEKWDASGNSYIWVRVSQIDGSQIDSAHRPRLAA